MVMVVNQDVFNNWEKSGRAEYVKVLRTLIEDGGSSIDSPRNRDLSRHIYELIWQAVRDKVKSDQAVQCLGELIATHPGIANTIIDVIAIVDTETILAEEKKDERARYISLVREIERFLSDGLVKERMEIDTLGECGILRQPKKFFTTVIKLKTKLFYKQQKFNLFREECEGYAKLVTELNQDLTSVSPTYIIEVIKSVIGYFNLDPNRVLDIILESFECQPEHHKFFISLLGEFLPDTRTMCELLNFKFSFYLSSNNEEGEVTPNSLYLVTALLIQHDIMKLEDVYVLLSPDDTEISRLADKDIRDAKEFVRKLNIVSTADKNKEDEKEEEKKKDPMENNQKFGLLEALIKVGAWKEAHKMICQLPTYYATSQPGISWELCNLVQILIDPVYRQFSALSPRIKTAARARPDNDHFPPQAETINDLKRHVVPMLLSLGPHASQDPVLLYKMLRICRNGLGIKDGGRADSESSQVVVPVQGLTEELYYLTITLMDEVFLPSLSLLTANCCLAEEIWATLKHFPYEQRYRLYDSWKGDTISAHPVLLCSKATVMKAIKRLMQRISKDNVKPSGRQLGKLSHSSPGLIFTYMLSQIQVYDNLIGPVVDSLKYLTNLSFDVLGYCIIEALNDPSRVRTKTDGTSISMWLTALAGFCGSVYKKHNIELTGLLQYVSNQLKAKHSLDLLIIKEIVAKMGGVEGAEEMTAEQLEASAGGELLRQEAASFTQIKNTRKPSQRLKDCLLEKELAVPLVLLMAQQGNCVVYQETENDHLKLVGKLFDQCHDTLVQFGTFLASNMSQDDYTARLPPIEQLLSEFHVHADIAFFLARPMFNHLITTKFDELRKTDKLWKQRTVAEKNVKHAEAAQLVMGPITDAVVPHFAPKVWEDMSPHFCTTFWSLTMYDLHVPESLYEKEIKKLKDAPAKLIDNRDLNSSKRKKETDRLHALRERLQDEEKRHKEHVERVMARLRQEKDTWFVTKSSRSAKNEVITQFLQTCLFPRCIFTFTDAVYAAKFVYVIHMLKTPNFSTLICFDRIFCDITYTVNCCTENEAGRYGRFLAALLETVMKWHSDKESFERECSGYPGFITKFKVADRSSQNNADSETVDFENFRHVCHKWHYKIAKALVVCLESKDFVQIRNSLIVLTKIIQFFPVIQNLATVIEKRIDKVCEDEKEKRQDLYIKARSYQGQLIGRKSKMMKECEFHVIKGKTSEEPENVSSPAKTEKDKGGDVVEEGEIRSSSKEKKREKERESRGRDSKERGGRSSAGRESREREHKNGDLRQMGPPGSRERVSVRRSQDRDSIRRSQDRESAHRSQERDSSDRDIKRRRGDHERDRLGAREKEKSPVLDRLEKNEKLRKEKREKEKGKKDKEEKEVEKDAKKDKKRDRDEAAGEASVKKRRGEEVDKHHRSPKQNGSEDKRKASSDRKREKRR